MLSNTVRFIPVNSGIYFNTNLHFIVEYICSSVSPSPSIMEVLEMTPGWTSLACFSTRRDCSKLARGSRTFLHTFPAQRGKNTWKGTQKLETPRQGRSANLCEAAEQRFFGRSWTPPAGRVRLRRRSRAGAPREAAPTQARAARAPCRRRRARRWRARGRPGTRRAPQPGQPEPLPTSAAPAPSPRCGHTHPAPTRRPSPLL